MPNSAIGNPVEQEAAEKVRIRHLFQQLANWALQHPLAGIADDEPPPA